MAEFTMSALMRKNKPVLLSLAAGIEFIDGDNTKAQIAEAILIMQDSRGNLPVGSTDPMGNIITETGATPRSPSPADVDYPKSIKIRRIEASQQNA